MKAVVDKIEIERPTDPAADLSALEDPDRYLGEAENDVLNYRAQDRDRIDAYNRGEWYFVGVVAKATVRLYFDSHPDGTYQIVELPSAGIWGVESDSDPSYFAELESDERAALADSLPRSG